MSACSGSAVGALCGIIAGVCMGDVTVSRVGCGSWDFKCARTWCGDACAALYALALALFATCGLGGLLIGSLASLLLGSVHIEEKLGVELPEWVRADIMIGATAALTLFAAVRFFFKTRGTHLPMHSTLHPPSALSPSHAAPGHRFSSVQTAGTDAASCSWTTMRATIGPHCCERDCCSSRRLL